MTEAGFLDELGAILDQPGPLARGQKLGEIETFDSLGILNIMALFDTLGLDVEPSRIAEAGIAAAGIATDVIDLAAIGSALLDRTTSHETEGEIAASADTEPTRFSTACGIYCCSASQVPDQALWTWSDPSTGKRVVAK